MDVRSLARAHTASNIRTLASYANAKDSDVEPDIKIRAIGMLLDRGWGKPQQDANVQAEIRVTIRKMLGGSDE
jgi:hypothetical protein